ncbi:IucA/IucC family siderophore biosynthesis protein [Bacillus aerolatus]|uniref:IucA/IucC family siderophore biosynthesis protein n=1 Tax=Bacillus aerolatus TaxID=2653354 RepID=A0A6I1FUH8_9BACI|nr:IucA/IucC family protein [Bacillus aerolatus]KAB7706223.1 IucA/IucC family siderophore biosynthesis protein [Bacillus aerolatus]
MVKKLEEIIESTEYLEVRRRIFRQLIESLIFENIVKPTRTTCQSGIEQFTIHGKDTLGDPVTYVCRGKQKVSFDRIRLTKEPIVRRKNDKEAEADSFALFFEEIAPFIGADKKQLAMFIKELNETHLKDAVAQYEWKQSDHKQAETYDELESEAMEGHPYHPSYKSRIGFTIEDHLNFGPDFKPSLSLIWLAVPKKEAALSISQSIHYEEFIKQELNPNDYERFVKKLSEKNQHASDVLFIPVHPWQWENIVMPQFFKDLKKGSIILLGEGSDQYIPQQSIRTLSNQTDQTKCYVKLPLSITNTSTNRVLAPHTVENAAKISDWLGTIKENDRYLKEELQLVFLREVMGISYDTRDRSSFEKETTYGVLGSIWRESIHSYLKEGEEAVPFNALYHCKKDGTALIDEWVNRYGIENWVKQLLHVSITPLIHLLYTHGIAMESHAQNMVLIHENGWPTRIALKDFHDGIRFKKEALSEPALCPNLTATPDMHKKINRNSFIETDQIELVRDFVHDAFFFINLSEIAFFFDEYYELQEAEFWRSARDVIESYQSRFSHLKERFAMFDLFAETIQVEQLTKRRMFPETELRIQHVKNPLFTAQEVTTC